MARNGTAAPPVALAGEADIAAVGALVADPSRSRMLLALGDGRALPAGRLASEAGVSAATASSHLAKLSDAGLLVVEAYGRHRYYRLAGPEVADLIEALQRLAPVAPVRSLRQGTRARALRDARTCYDHLAGRLAVEIMASLIARGHLAGGDGTFDPAAARGDTRAGAGRDVDYELTAEGAAFLEDLGVVAPPGAPAGALLRRLERAAPPPGRRARPGPARPPVRARVDRRAEAARAVQVTAAGEAGLLEAFGVGPGDG